MLPCVRPLFSLACRPQPLCKVDVVSKSESGQEELDEASWCLVAASRTAVVFRQSRAGLFDPAVLSVRALGVTPSTGTA